MLRNQVIDVNINFDVNENDNCLPGGKRCEASTLSLEEKPALTLKKDYQDSG